MLIDALLAAGERGGGRPAVADPTRELSFGNLIRLAAVLRRQVERATARPHVGIMLPAGGGFAATFYGVLWAGRVPVPLNFLLQADELRAVVHDAELDTVFTIRHFAEPVATLPVRAVFLEDLSLRREMVWQRLRKTPPPPRVQRDDTAVLLYTSGTSGLPKGVCQTYGNLAHDVAACIAHARLSAGHRFLGVLPPFHSFGLTTLLLVPVALGASVFYLPRFQPAGVLEAIRTRRISVVLLVASMYGALLNAKGGGREDLAALSFAVSGGEALPDAVFERFGERFGVRIVQGYGMTEAAPVVSLDLPWSLRPGTVGRALPGVTVTAEDDAGRPLPPGQEGELVVRGPIVMKGYYRREAETRAVLAADGGYRTGDLGRLDADGYLTITGRKKELIIVGGENVYPREVETVLSGHPAVREAAVVGRRDAARGEVVAAFVTLRAGATATELELREFCRERLAGYKVPRRVVIADDLPRGPTGKILKRRLGEVEG